MEGEHAETSGKFGVYFLVNDLLESVVLCYAKILVSSHLLDGQVWIKVVFSCDPQFYKAI